MDGTEASVQTHGPPYLLALWTWTCPLHCLQYLRALPSARAIPAPPLPAKFAPNRHAAILGEAYEEKTSSPVVLLVQRGHPVQRTKVSLKSLIKFVTQSRGNPRCPLP